jgi:hypothetical protein
MGHYAQPITIPGMHPVPDLDLFAFNFSSGLLAYVI